MVLLFVKGVCSGLIYTYALGNLCTEVFRPKGVPKCKGDPRHGGNQSSFSHLSRKVELHLKSTVESSSDQVGFLLTADDQMNRNHCTAMVLYPVYLWFIGDTREELITAVDKKFKERQQDNPRVGVIKVKHLVITKLHIVIPKRHKG